MMVKAARFLCYGLTGLFIALSVRTIVKGEERIVAPPHYAANYVESEKDYSVQFMESYDWESLVPEDVEEIEYTVLETEEILESFATSDVYEQWAPRFMDENDLYLIAVPDSKAWSLVSNGMFTSYPSVSYKSIKDKLADLKNECTETVTVDCWYWKYPNDSSNMEKVTVTKTFAVNSCIASMFKHIFADIYYHPSKPVINIGDSGMGTWVLRGKNHNSSNTLSAHSIGTAIDINPSTGSYYVDGKWYGNAYNQKPMPTSIWNQLPESHTKHHVLYEDSPIVKVFKSYGWYWGGDWSSSPDPMHFAFLGDGKTARVTGYSNYVSERR